MEQCCGFFGNVFTGSVDDLDDNNMRFVESLNVIMLPFKGGGLAKI